MVEPIQNATPRVSARGFLRFHTKLLQILVVGNIVIDSLADNLLGLDAVLLTPLGVFGLYC